MRFEFLPIAERSATMAQPKGTHFSQERGIGGEQEILQHVFGFAELPSGNNDVLQYLSWNLYDIPWHTGDRV